MEIAEARALTPDELAVGADAVAQAEADAAAAEARQLLDALERQAVEAATVPKAAPVLEARQLAEFAVKRAERTRQLAARALDRLDGEAGELLGVEVGPVALFLPAVAGGLGGG
jgi:hypothetical protein